MRCPKCGYISFDHMETCLKCKKKIPAGGEAEGTTYHASSPSFLRVPDKEEFVEEGGPSPEMELDGSDEEFEFTDPDLDVLVGEDEELSVDDSDESEAVMSFDEASLEGAEDDYQLETDEEAEFTIEPEEGTISFAEEDESAPDLNIPDEISDISDLAPPEEVQAAPVDTGAEMSISLDDEQGVDENRDLDGLDLDLGLGQVAKSTNEEEVSLSLDDIDFSVEEDSEIGGLEMDLNLDELGGSPVPKKKKSSSELDGISLSLD